MIHYKRKTVIGGFTSAESKVLNPFRKTVLQIGKTEHCPVANRTEPLNVGGEIGLFNIYERIGTESRKHLDVETLVVGELLMKMKIVARIVGGAENPYIRLFNETSCAHAGLFQHAVAAVIDIFGIGGGKRLVNTEITF